MNQLTTSKSVKTEPHQKTTKKSSKYAYKLNNDDSNYKPPPSRVPISFEEEIIEKHQKTLKSLEEK